MGGNVSGKGPTRRAFTRSEPAGRQSLWGEGRGDPHTNVHGPSEPGRSQTCPQLSHAARRGQNKVWPLHQARGPAGPCDATDISGVVAVTVAALPRALARVLGTARERKVHFDPPPGPCARSCRECSGQLLAGALAAAGALARLRIARPTAWRPGGHEEDSSGSWAPLPRGGRRAFPSSHIHGPRAVVPWARRVPPWVPEGPGGARVWGGLCTFSAGRTSGPALGPPSCGLAPAKPLAAVRGRPHTSGPVSHVPGLPSRSLQKQEVDLGPKLTPPASNVSSIYKKTHKFHL